MFEQSSATFGLLASSVVKSVRASVRRDLPTAVARGDDVDRRTALSGDTEAQRLPKMVVVRESLFEYVSGGTRSVRGEVGAVRVDAGRVRIRKL